MKAPLPPPAVSEEAALGVRPQLLPPHSGLARYYARLASDKRYRNALAFALALALLAGSDLGNLATSRGGVVAGLWALVAASLAGRTLTPFASNSQKSNLGSAEIRTAAIAAVVAGVIVSLSTLPSIFRGEIFPWSFVISWTVAAALTFAYGVRPAGPLSDGRLLGYGALLAWFLAAIGLIGGAVSPVGMLRCVFPVMLFVATTIQPGFKNAVAATIALHVGGLTSIYGPTVLPSWAHVLFAVLEAILLVYAGFRDADAALLRLPRATYRVAPWSIVPRLDRARDFPVMIDVE